jgi:hypothetical protein
MKVLFSGSGVGIRSRVGIAVAVTAICLFGLLPAARAEVGIREYRRMQREAPEEVRIEVQRVRETPIRERERERERLGRAVQVELTARVLRVNRSQQRIHDGEEIHISYVTHRREQNKFGPGEPPIPEERKMYPAFLQKVEGDRRLFTPAAGMYTFERLEVR